MAIKSSNSRTENIEQPQRNRIDIDVKMLLKNENLYFNWKPRLVCCKFQGTAAIAIVCDR